MMKTKIFFTLIILAFATTGALAQSNKVVKQNRQVAAFSSISATGGWDVIIRQGNRQSVTTEVSREILDRAVIEVKNGTLHIYNKSQNHVFSFRNMRNITQKAYVTVTDLKKITASGGVDIRFETPLETNDFDLSMSGGTDLENLTLSCDNFTGNFSGGSDAEIIFSSPMQNLKADMSGGSDVDFTNINAQRCRVVSNGGSDVMLTGKTAELNISAGGGSDVSAAEFNAQNCTADFSGAADGNIRVTNSLEVSVSGGSDVVVYGNPKNVTKTVHRSSSLKIK